MESEEQSQKTQVFDSGPSATVASFNSFMYYVHKKIEACHVRLRTWHNLKEFRTRSQRG
jgi:hypothetical protein